MTTSRSPSTRPVSDLVRWARPGRSAFRLAATAASIITLAVIAQWIGIGLLLQAVLKTADPREPLLLVVTALLVATAARLAERAATDHGRRRVAHALRLDVLQRLLPDGARPFDAPRSAESATLVLGSVDAIADHAAASQPLHRSLPVSMGLTLAAVAALCWPIAAFLLIATALMPLNLRIAGLVAADESARQQEAQDRLTGLLLDALRGAAVLRTHRAVDLFRERLDLAGQRLDRQTGRLLKKVFLSAVVMDVVITFAIAVAATFVGLVLLGYLTFPWQPPVTLAQGFAALTLCPVYFLPVRRLGAAYHDRDTAVVARDAISRLQPAAPASTHHALPQAPALVMTQVRVSVPEQASPLLETALTITPGRWTGVTGPSGAGKTTLLSVISGLVTPTQGEVRWVVRGQTLLPRPGMAAWVGQHTALLEGSLADNLRLATSSATEHDLLSVLGLVGLDELLEQMSDGLHTWLGPDLWQPSAGEGRRIAIARAALRGRRVWMLDEPTAHLDDRAAATVVDALRAVTRGCTVVVATHDDRVLDHCRSVIRLDGGGLTAIDSAQVRR